MWWFSGVLLVVSGCSRRFYVVLVGSGGISGQF